MSISCKQILFAILLGMFTFTMPVAADEPDELLKLSIETYPENMISAAKWRNMLDFKYQFSNYGNVYGSQSDFDELRALHTVVEQRFEEALGPTVDVSEEKPYAPTAERIEEARAKGSKVIEELFDEFGRDKFLRVVQFQNLICLRGIVNRFNINDPSFLSIPAFREKMNLTAEQREALDAIDGEYKERVNERLTVLFVDVGKLNLEKLKRITDELSPEQRILTERLIGQPLNWAWLVATNDEREIVMRIGERRSQNMLMGVYEVFLPEGCDLDVRQFQKLDLRPDYREGDLEWPHFDSLLATLLSSDFTAAQIQFSDKQQAEIKAFITEIRKTSIISAKFANERLANLVGGTATFPAKLEQILVPIQIDWLRQTELQFFTGDRRTTFGITDPVMVQRLELSDGTVRNIEEIASEFDEPFTEKVSMAHEIMAKIGFEYGQKRIEVLEQKDRERFQLLTNVNCDRLEEIMKAVVEPSRVKTKYSLN